jgi:SAM-dependent methyltransferase
MSTYLATATLKCNFVLRPCPICHKDEYNWLFTDINRREGLPLSVNVVECRHCGMHYLNPAPDSTSLARLYREGSVDTVRKDLTEVQPISRIPSAPSLLRSIIHAVNGFFRGHPHDWPDYMGKGCSLLDFGCLDGSKLVYWYQCGWQVAGIDLNERAIDIARRRFPDGLFWCGDVSALEISERFDYIRADNVVEHLFDPLVYLTSLAKLLKPGGWLRIFVPNGAALSARLFGRYSAVYWMPFHLNLFSAITLERALRQSGLINVNCDTFTPIGSWTWTQRQRLLRPGFNRRPPSLLDRTIQRLRILNYPGETLAQWFGMGEELVATGQRPR